MARSSKLAAQVLGGHSPKQGRSNRFTPKLELLDARINPVRGVVPRSPTLVMSQEIEAPAVLQTEFCGPLLYPDEYGDTYTPEVHPGDQVILEEYTFSLTSNSRGTGTAAVIDTVTFQIGGDFTALDKIEFWTNANGNLSDGPRGDGNESLVAEVWWDQIAKDGTFTLELGLLHTATRPAELLPVVTVSYEAYNGAEFSLQPLKVAASNAVNDVRLPVRINAGPSETIYVTAQSDLAVSLSTEQYMWGETYVFANVTVTNWGPDPVAWSVITLDVPEQFSLAWTDSDGFVSQLKDFDSTVYAEVPYLGVGDSWTVSLEFEVGDYYGLATLIADVYQDNGDPWVHDNWAFADIFVGNWWDDYGFLPPPLPPLKV